MSNHNQSAPPEAIKIKTEPETGAPVRLTSFRPPRDLMLTTPNKQGPKKVFTPNLNVSRNKNKGPVVNESRKDTRKNESQNGRNRKNCFQNKGSNVLKSSGVFSEGIAVTDKRPYNRENYSDGSSKDPASYLPKPVFKTNKNNKNIGELKDLKIKEYSSEEEEEDSSFLNSHFAPICLPMEVSSGPFHFRPGDIPSLANVIKSENEIKTEPEDYPNATESTDNLGKEHKSVNLGMFDNSPDSLFMFQFPDCLPEREPPTNTDTQDKTDETPKEPAPPNACTFEHMEEGQIGKILLYKSGKLKMQIGNVYYDLTLGSQTCFRQDVMSISVDTESNTGTMINLGKITSKIMAIPDWEKLLEDSSGS